MLLSKNVEIRLGGTNIKYYEGLGYTMPYTLDKKGRKVCGGKTIVVDVKDLSINNAVKLTFKCDICNEEYIRSYNQSVIGKKSDIIKGRDLCKKCTQKVISLNQITTYEECCKAFEEFNLKVVSDASEYVNSKSKIRVLCVCGKEYTTDYTNLLSENKKQCNECGIRLRSGENSYRWKGGITKESDKIRKSKEYKEWRGNVFKRDNYTCQCCGDNVGGNLSAHHIDNFSTNIDKRFCIDNGITLCDECHNPNKKNSYHYLYGTSDNNAETLKRYIGIRKLFLDFN